jgi:DNA transformation protein and related proteins
MASTQRNVDFILEQLTDAGDVSARKMFGEYAIYRRNKIVALFCDDQLFIKPTVSGKAFIGKVQEAPPYPGAKPWLLITGDHCEDGEWLSELVLITERELPPPKPKAPRPKAAKARSAKAKVAKARPTKTKAAKTKVAKARPTKTKAPKTKPSKSKAQRTSRK